MARKKYLKNPLKEARELFLERLQTSEPESEAVPVSDALHRITSEPVFAKVSSPHYHAAAMDGIGVRAVDTFGATEFNPKRLRDVVPPAGFEPTTPGLGILCSIRLSYGGVHQEADEKFGVPDGI